MKFIKQISTGQIIHREMPHTDKTLDNAVHTSKIDRTDLEVTEENWTEDEWNSAMHNQLDYADKRKAEYDQMGNQFEMIFDDQDTWRNKINEIKAKYPKE